MDWEALKEIFSKYSPDSMDEDGEFQEDWCTKADSLKRFKRNHFVMGKILDEKKVQAFIPPPSLRNWEVILKKKRFVTSVLAKARIDLEHMEREMEAQKNLLERRATQFNDTYNKLVESRPIIDDKFVDDLAEKYYQEMKAGKLDTLDSDKVDMAAFPTDIFEELAWPAANVAVKVELESTTEAKQN